MKALLPITAGGEAATGFILLVYPQIVVRLLFNAEIAGAGIVMSRIAGISLIALGVGCWPVVSSKSGADGGFRGMLTYSLLATLYLAVLGVAGKWVGLLLWPAVVVHAGVTILLVRAWRDRQHPTG